MGRPPKTLDGTASQAARLGAALRYEREVRGVTQQELAEAIHFSRGHLALVELAKAQASEEFVRLCDEALDAGGRLLAIYPEVITEREREREKRLRPRRSPPRSDRPNDNGDAPSDAAEYDDAGALDPGTVATFLGGTGTLTIALPLRTLRTGRRLIAQEDFEAVERLARCAQVAGIRTRFDYVEPNGDVDLSPSSLLLLCGPKSSPVVTHLIDSDPFFSFGPDEDGRWRLTEKETGADLLSPLDMPFPANQDLAYVARLPRPGSDRTLLVIAGVHAAGSLGAAAFLANAEHLDRLHSTVGARTFSMVVGCTFTRWPLRILATETVVAPRIHP